MQPQRNFLASSVCLLCIVLTGCGTSPLSFVKKANPLAGWKASTPKLPSMKRGDLARFSFQDLMPSQIPVVKVDQSQLVTVESGREKALAYEQNQARWPSWFGENSDFKEQELPSGLPIEADFGLLPPKPH